MVILEQNPILEEKSQSGKGRQLLFYVSFFFVVIWAGWFHPFAASEGLAAFPYDSSLVQEFLQEEINTYFFKDIDNLKQALIPRMIYFMDSGNYNISGRMNIKGILFTFKDTHAKQVNLVAGNNGFKPIAMKRNSYGVWYYVMAAKEYVESAPQKKILYKFMSDGIFQNDPTHANQEEDGAGGMISYYYLTNASLRAQEGVMILSQKSGYGQKVLFRLYRPQAQSISLMGTFNQWNPELDNMQKSADGYFTIEKTLPPGEYVFLFRIDGKNEFIGDAGEAARYHPAYGMVSSLRIP